MASLQSLTVEYVVSGSLDGNTPAPRIVIDQSDDDATRFDVADQIYRVEVENLGLIDPDLGVGGSIGPRCIPFLWIDTEVVGDAGAAAELVGIVRDAAKLQSVVADLAGDAGGYLDDGFMVAQGSAIRLSGFTAGADPIVVRVSILVPESCLDFALAAVARADEANATGAPARAILPRLDLLDGGGGPALTYKLEVGETNTIVIQGKNLEGLVAFDFVDVQAGGNAGAAPTVVGTPVVTDTTITMELDGTDGENFDFWGILLTDGDGNVYGAPSPLKLWVGE